MRLGLAFMLLAPLTALASNVLIVPSDEARKLGLGDAVVDVLTTAGVPLKVAGPKAPAAACTHERDARARRTCLVEAATLANSSTVLLLTASEQRRTVVAALELLAQANGKVLATLTIKAPAARWAKQAAAQLRTMKALIASQRFTPREPAPPAVEPVAEHRSVPPQEPKPVAEPKPLPPQEPGPVAERKPQPTEPKPTPPRPAVAAKPEPKPEPRRSDRPTAAVLAPGERTTRAAELTSGLTSSRAGAWTATGVTIAAVAVSATAGIVGLSSKGRLESAPGGIASVPRREAVALQGQANAQLSVALIAGIVAAASGTAAVVLWGLDK